jgi:hypothetical protein
MARKYLGVEHRREYLKKWRSDHREQQNKYLRDYLRRTGKKYYVSKGEITENMAGTCGVGRKYEKIALTMLSGSVDCNLASFAGKWDIEWNGLGIDVKMRNKNKRGAWGFTTKPNPKADFFLCFCVEEEKIVGIYFFPANIFKTSLYVCDNNKYSSYRLVFHEANVN